MKDRRALVAGIGNVFLGDDGFGVAVAEKLARSGLPEGVLLMDVGIRGLDLVYALLEGWETVILVDATMRGGNPGTLYVLEPEVPASSEPPTLVDAHAMDPARVLAYVRASGGRVDRFRVVACEAEPVGPDDEPRMGLSPAVAAAVEPACDIVYSLVSQGGAVHA